MTIKEVIEALERFAPLPLQEDYDNAGLQTGLTEADASGALLCLDVTPDIISEAIDKGCNLIISHHPLIFRGLKQVCDQNMVAKAVRMAIRNDITIYSAHTNLDNAPKGVNLEIARRMGAVRTEPLCPITRQGVNGTSGIIAELPEAEEPQTFLERVKTTFNIHTLAANYGPKDRKIQRIGICGGAGDFLLEDAIAQGCDCFLTGEMHYHQYFGHEQEIWIGVMGHYQSEQFTIELLEHILQNEVAGLRLMKTELCTNPIQYI